MEPIAPELLEILVCPESHQPVRPVPAEIVKRLAALQAEGRLKNRVGQPVTDALQAALVREDGRYAYPVTDGIPVMLIDEALPLDQLDTPPDQ